MRALLPTIVLAWLVALAGCSSDRPPPLGIFELDGYVPGDAARDANDLGLQTFDIIPIDVVTPDVPPPDVVVPVGTRCNVDEECSFGSRCLDNACAIDTCRTVESPCSAGERCDLRCVPTRDRCAGVTCSDRQTCVNGICVAGCFAAPCSGVECPSGQFCDPASGACRTIVPCSAACADGNTCHVACLPASNCDGVVCPTGQVCSDGACVSTPCTGVTCTGSSICVNGTCRDTCACDPPCDRGPRDRCVVGQCQCQRSCPEGIACGADDGCGGQCSGACENPFAVCDPDTFMCVCMPRCTADAPCGSSDGCGGQCAGGCADGFMCNLTTSMCDCIPHCPAVEEFANTACGENVPNLCPGAQSCGTGTRCPPGLMCSMAGVCEMSDEDAGMPEDGSMCPPGRTSCGESCFNLQTDTNHCGGCDTVCPTGSVCTAGACVCTGGNTLCGGRCVNTMAEQSNCGACGNVCPALTACTAGVCECVPRCTTNAALVTCYTAVPNDCPGGPSCGLGRMCPLGSSCSADERRCVCTPICPPGAACNDSDGCGGHCAGSCSNGGGCARNPMVDGEYICSAAACAGGCPCGQVCRNNACVPDTCPNGQPPCNCTCCPIGQTCTGGSCQPIPP